jgi:Ferritin-like domain
MNRRRFLIGTLGAGTVTLAGPLLPAGAATEDELAFANFGAAGELLLKDYYSKALEAKVARGAGVTILREGRSASARHAKALADLLTGAGDVAPAEEDFEFAWPARTFRSSEAAVATGLGVLRALAGAYQSAAASVSIPTYRVLFASLAGSAGQQVGAMTWLSGAPGVHPFPAALDLEAASAAVERYLG